MKPVHAAIALAIAVTTSAAAEDSCPPLKRIAAIDMTLPKKGPALVPMTIGGQPVQFILSTATAQSGISAAATDRLQLKRRSSAVTAVAGRGKFSNTIVLADDVRLGNARFASIDLRELAGERLSGADGVLGPDLLRNYSVDLDFYNAKLNLISRDHCPGKVVYWQAAALAAVPMRVTDDNFIVFKVNLDGHDIEATIETGQPRTTLTRPTASGVFGLDKTSPGARPEKDGERFRYRFAKLSVEGLVVKNPDIMVVPDLAATAPKRGNTSIVRGLHQPPPLRLGLSTLRQLHVFIDYKNLTLYFTPADPTAPAAIEPDGEE